jgi:hypothetical protein
VISNNQKDEQGSIFADGDGRNLDKIDKRALKERERQRTGSIGRKVQSAFQWCVVSLSLVVDLVSL